MDKRNEWIEEQYKRHVDMRTVFNQLSFREFALNAMAVADANPIEPEYQDPFEEAMQQFCKPKADANPVGGVDE